MKASLTELELRKLSATLEAARNNLQRTGRPEDLVVADACDHWLDIVESWPRPCNITERS